MTREEIIGLAREAGFLVPTLFASVSLWVGESEALERFAALVTAEVDKKWAKGEAKIRIPTVTMEQEFSKFHRLGYKAGATAEREACAQICDEEARLFGVTDDVCASRIRARGNT